MGQHSQAPPPAMVMGLYSTPSDIQIHNSFFLINKGKQIKMELLHPTSNYISIFGAPNLVTEAPVFPDSATTSRTAALAEASTIDHSNSEPERFGDDGRTWRIPVSTPQKSNIPRPYQQTPGAYPKPPTNSLCFGIPESFGGLGMSGVCSRGMLGFP